MFYLKMEGPEKHKSTRTDSAEQYAEQSTSLLEEVAKRVTKNTYSPEQLTSAAMAAIPFWPSGKRQSKKDQALDATAEFVTRDAREDPDLIDLFIRRGFSIPFLRQAPNCMSPHFCGRIHRMTLLGHSKMMRALPLRLRR